MKENTNSKQISKNLDLDKCERVIDNLGSFSASCEECKQHLLELKDIFIQLEANVDWIGDTEIKHINN